MSKNTEYFAVNFLLSLLPFYTLNVAYNYKNNIVQKDRKWRVQQNVIYLSTY